MFKAIKDFVKEILMSRLGLLLAVINICIFLIYMNSICWGKCSTGHPFNLSAFMQYYLLLNLPAWMLSVILLTLVGIKENDYWWVKSVVEFLTVFIMSIFWLLTGYFIGKVYSKLKEY